jgi:HK97 family phage portal protein
LKGGEIVGLFKKREVVLDESQCDDVLLRAVLNGIAIDRQSTLAIPAVSGCVDFICNTFAQIPFKLYKESVKDGKKVTEEVTDERVSIINDDTRDKLDGFQFKKAICEDYLLGKGGYAYIGKVGNKFNALYYVDCDRVSVNKNTNAIFKDYTLMVDAETYKDYQFIKLLRNTKDGASGTGLTEEISKALQTAFKRLCYDYDLTVTGGSRKGFIKSQKHLDKKAIDALKEAWENYYAGNANTVILNDGMEFQEASNTSKENEINAKDITFNDVIKNIFHIGATYEETIKNAIMPIATAFATALNRDFLLEKEKKSFYFAPDTKELYRGSLKERYDAYKIAIESGFKTRNEIRYMEDDDALEGLDVINLGLGDVLLDTATGMIYTPNTNTMVKMGGESNEDGENPQASAPSDEVNTEAEQVVV